MIENLCPNQSQLENIQNVAPCKKFVITIYVSDGRPLEGFILARGQSSWRHNKRPIGGFVAPFFKTSKYQSRIKTKWPKHKFLNIILRSFLTKHFETEWLVISAPPRHSSSIPHWLHL